MTKENAKVASELLEQIKFYRRSVTILDKCILSPFEYILIDSTGIEQKFHLELDIEDKEFQSEIKSTLRSLFQSKVDKFESDLEKL